MIDKKIIVGSGGGSSSSDQHVPVESANSANANTYAKLVDLIGEGQIGGPAVGNSWYMSTYYNDIPVQNTNGSLNYNGVILDARHGTTNQDYLSTIDGIQNSITVGSAVTISGGPITKTITNLDVDNVKVVISIPAMMNQLDNGDINPTTLQFRISVIPDNGLGTESTVVDPYTNGNIYRKHISEYRKQYTISNIGQYGSGPWVIKLTRITPDSGSTKMINAFSWYSYTTVINTKLRYSDRAVIGHTLNSYEFGNRIPSRAYRVNGLYVKVPNNYNPITREYTGSWDGTFKLAVTNNPAWIIYYLLTDVNNGLGSKITEDMVDKWTLYACGVYCDENITSIEKVKQANGTYLNNTIVEPRFTFNGILEVRNQGLQTVVQMCGVMGAYPIWVDGQVSFVQDKPIVMVPRPVSLSNVTSEGFTYTGIPKRNRHSVVKVSWNDPNNFGKLDVIELVDEKSIIDFGYNEMDFAAFGCTSRTEAIRRGNYVLDTDINARETVSFKGGLEWADCLPGELIAVQDSDYAGKVLEGRVKSSTTTSITLDKTITLDSGSTYTLYVQQATGAPIQKTLLNSSGTTSILTWSGAVTPPFVGAVAVISESNLTTRQFVVVSVSEDDGFYTITGIEYDPDKYARIESGVVSQKPVDTIFQAQILQPPSNLNCASYTYTEGDQQLRKYGIQLSWTYSDDPRTTYYELQYRPTTSGWIKLGTTTDNNFDFKDVPSDTYDFGVRGVGVGLQSAWVTYTDFVLNATLSHIAPPTNLRTVTDDDLWTGQDCEVLWDLSGGSDYNDNNVGDSNVAYYKIEVRKPDTTLLRSFDTAKDATSYIYTYANNVADNNGTPIRTLLFYAYSVDTFGLASETYATLSATNPAPDLSSSTPIVTAKFGYLQIQWTISSDNDMSHYKIYGGTTYPPTNAVGITNHPGNYFDWSDVLVDTSYYIQIEPYDLFGAGIKSVIPSAVSPVKIPNINVDAELTNSIIMSDSDNNTESTLLKLFDGIYNTTGVSYTLSGTDKYIQYQFGIEDYIDRVSIWASSTARVYVATSVDGTTWNYLSGNTAHGLDSGKLTSRTTQAISKTNYWQLSAGINLASLPDKITAKYVKLWLTGTYTTIIYEFVASRILISELAAIGSVSALSSNIGVMKSGQLISTNYPTSGCSIDLDTGTIVGAITFKSNSSGYNNISDKPAAADIYNSYALDTVSNTYVDLVSYNAELENIYNQLDGYIETWYGTVDPTLSNAPAVNWTTNDIKETHVGDLYYNNTSGDAFRFINNSGYSWLLLTDTGVATALAAAQTAQDTADSKIKMFVTQPVPPYDIGDLWDADGTPRLLKRCNTTRATGSYAAGDWTTISNNVTTTSQLTDTANLGLTATWSNVTNAPTDLGDLDSTANTKLNGIETGATVGAPTGTNVGNTPAATVEANAASSKTAVTAMESDSQFSIAEKRQWQINWPGMQSNYTGVKNAASANGVSYTALDTARNNLYNFLNASPQLVWASTLTNSAITQGTLTGYTSAFYTQLQLCLNATSAKYASNAETNAINSSIANMLNTSFASTMAWTFNNEHSNWIVENGTIVDNPNSISLTTTTTGCYFYTNVAFNPGINGSRYFRLRCRLRLVSGTGTWKGRVYYKTASHDFTSSYYVNATSPSNKNDWNVIEWDMSTLTVGGTDYITNTITGIRFDISSTSGDVWEIDWASVGEYSITDKTSENTAAAILNQGALATASTVDWSTQITGTGKPVDGATNNSSWNHPSDETKIDGGDLYAGSLIQISEGGKLIAGADNIQLRTISGTNDILVCPDGGTIAGNDFCQLKSGNINFYMWRGGVHQLYKSLNRVEVGTGTNGVTVTIPGYFRSKPKVIISPLSLPTYHNSYTAQAQTIKYNANAVYETTPGSGIWYFTPTALLALSSGSTSTNVGDMVSKSSDPFGTTYPQNITGFGSVQSNTITVTPSNVTGITINVGFVSYAYINSTKVGGESEYYIKKYYRTNVNLYVFAYYNGAWNTIYGVNFPSSGGTSKVTATAAVNPNTNIAYIYARLDFISTNLDEYNTLDGPTPFGANGGVTIGIIYIDSYSTNIASTTGLVGGTCSWMAVGE